MRKILRLDMFSTVRLFVIVYALIGFYAASSSVIRGEESVECPFGFQYPMLHATVDVTIKLPQAAWITPFLVIIAAMFYAVTGIISGVAAILVYNLTSRFWPGISATTEGEKAPVPEPSPEVDLV